MRFQLQDFFEHGDMVLRLRHRQPFVALGPPSSWPDRRRVAKKHKKEEVGKNEKNAKLPLFRGKNVVSTEASEFFVPLSCHAISDLPQVQRWRRFVARLRSMILMASWQISHPCAQFIQN